MSKLLQGYVRCQDNGNSAVTTWGKIHVKTVYQNCKNMFIPTWPSPKQISVITFSTKCQGPGTSRASAGTPLQTAFFSTNHKFEDKKEKKHVLKTYSAFPIVLTSKITLQEFGHEPLNVLKAIVGRISG